MDRRHIISDMGHIVQAASVRIKRLRARFKTSRDLAPPVPDDVAAPPSSPQAAKQSAARSAVLWSRVTASVLERKHLFGIIHKALLVDLEAEAISESVLRSVQRRRSVQAQTGAATGTGTASTAVSPADSIRSL